MYTIISAFCLAETMSIYPNQCKNVKSREKKLKLGAIVQRFETEMVDLFLTCWEQIIIMQILEDHMSSIFN